MSILGMFARYPEPGTTKTRLAATIGDRAAADVYDCFVQDLVQRAAELADQLWIAITPDSDPARKWLHTLPVLNSDTQLKLLAQPPGTLGDRIAWFFRQAAAQGGGPAVLIGTDSPDLPSARITQAMEMLISGSADAVTVPAADGGYVLIGLSRDPHTLFDGIRWSTPFTLLDTIDAATTAGLRLAVLSTWYDVDHVENLGTLLALQKQPGLTEAAPCPRTAEYLEGLFPRITDCCSR